MAGLRTYQERRKGLRGLGPVVLAMALAFALAGFGAAAFPQAAWAQTADGTVGINLEAPSTVQQDAGAGKGSQGLVGVNVTVQRPAEGDEGTGSGSGSMGGSNGADGLVGVSLTIPETAKQDPAAGGGSQGLAGVNLVVAQPSEAEKPGEGRPNESKGADGLVGINLEIPTTALQDPEAGIGSEGLVGVNLQAQTGLFVTFDPNGGTMPTTAVSAYYDKTIDAPAVAPDWPGRTFGKLVDGAMCYWFKDSACTEPWDFQNDTVKDTMTLYAGWTWDEPHAEGDVVLHMVYGNTTIDNADSYGITGYAPNYDSGDFGGATEDDASDELAYTGDYYLGGGEPLDATLALPDARMIKSDKLSGTFLGWYDERGNRHVQVDRFSYGSGAPDYVQEFWAKWDTTPTHTVTFDAGENAWFDEAGSPRYKYVEVADRKTVARPTDPVHGEDAAAAPGGWRFGGWFYDEACTQPYSFGTRVGADLVLYAKWQATEAPPDPPEEKLDVTVPVSVGFAVNADTGEVVTPDMGAYAIKSRTARPVAVERLDLTTEKGEMEGFFSLKDAADGGAGDAAWQDALRNTSLLLRSDRAQGDLKLAFAQAGAAGGPVWENGYALTRDERDGAYTIEAFDPAGADPAEQWWLTDACNRLDLKFGMEVPDELKVRTDIDGRQKITHLKVTVATVP